MDIVERRLLRESQERDHSDWECPRQFMKIDRWTIRLAARLPVFAKCLPALTLLRQVRG